MWPSEDKERWYYDFTFKDPDTNSDKFWRARTENKNLYVNFGRTGTRGSTIIKVFSDTAAASSEMHDRAREKVVKGYGPTPPRPRQPITTPVDVKYVPLKWEAVCKPWYTAPALPKPLPAYKANELDTMPLGFFNDLVARVATEKKRREAAELEAKNKKNASISKLQNFLLCCAHAMACRAALRWSAAHEPIGKGLQHGLPWNAFDGTRLAMMVAGTGPLSHSLRKAGAPHCYSNPMTWTTVGDLQHWLSERSGRVSPYDKYARYGGTEFMH